MRCNTVKKVAERIIGAWQGVVQLPGAHVDGAALRQLPCQSTFVLHRTDDVATTHMYAYRPLRSIVKL